MRKILVLIFIALYINGFGQNITVSNTGNNAKPYWLAQNVLTDPNFKIQTTYDTITYLPISQPSTVQVGYFTAVGTGLGIDTGIVMATDNVKACVPGNADYSSNVLATDPQLLKVLNQIKSTSTTMNDKVEIIFDFVAPSDSIQFEYVFASREYKSFTCSNFNDVFGFFLTGNGINGSSITTKSTVNLATIPGTTVPVAINTINQGYSSSGTDKPCTDANPNYKVHSTYYTTNTAWSSQSSSNLTSKVNMAGWTKPFTAQAKVVCGQTYTIRLKIADVQDGAYTSAVFLKAKSFKSPAINVIPVAGSGNSFIDSQVVEGCEPKLVIFEKDGNVGKDMVIHFDYFGNAIPGVDYATLPDSLFLPAGVKRDTLKVYAFDDGLVEPNDTLIIYQNAVRTECADYKSRTIELFFRDKTPVSALAEVDEFSNDTILCPGDPADLIGTPSGGEGILYGGWLDDTTATLFRTVEPGVTTTYYFWVTDECYSDSIVDSVTVYVIPYDSIQTQGDTIRICDGESTTVTAVYDLGKPPYTLEWDDLSTDDQREVTPTKDSTWYVFTVVDGCGFVAKDSCLVWISPVPRAQFSYMNNPGVPLRIDFNNLSINGHTFEWDFGDGTTSNDTTPSHSYERPDEYWVTLRITTEDGCVDEYSMTVVVETDYFIYIPSTFTPDGDGVNDYFQIQGVGFESFKIHIFNRWGNEVFYSDDINVSWDGTHRGKDVPKGVYSYTIFIQMPLGDIAEKKGTVMVYR